MNTVETQYITNDYYGKDAFRYEVRYYDMRTQSMAKTLYADFVASASSFDPEQYALFADEIHKSNNAGCWDGEYQGGGSIEDYAQDFVDCLK